MRLLLILLVASGLAACNIVYKLPTRQGNVIEQKQLDQLRVGMSQDQVRFLLGTPLAANPFREDRWDYVGYYKSPRGQVMQRHVALHFEEGRLARMEGLEQAGDVNDLATPDVKTLLRQERKDSQESEDPPETGVILTRPPDAE